MSGVPFQPGMKYQHTASHPLCWMYDSHVSWNKNKILDTMSLTKGQNGWIVDVEELLKESAIVSV